MNSSEEAQEAEAGSRMTKAKPTKKDTEMT